MQNNETLGQRIMIIGCGGAGKSTLARRIGDMLELPVIHLDAEQWRAGWVETPKDEWNNKVTEMAAGERWILDGNYSGTIPIRLAKADTVLLLDYSWWVCLWRVLKRRVQYRGRTRPDLAPGCPERLNLAFIKWICIDFPRHSLPRILQLLEEHGQHACIIIHRSPSETRRLLAGIREGTGE